jgi:DNA-binding transcriptional LysR family regulator
VHSIKPHFDEIEAAVAGLSHLRDKPAGRIRISSVDHAAQTILWPRLATFLAEYPDVQVEVVSDNTLMDIVSEGFDAGIRMGERLARDMIALPIGPDIRMAVVATPGYFAKHGKPRGPEDLSKHNCINLRLPTLGGIYAWEFEKAGREINIRVEGQLTVNDIGVIRRAALEGVGLAFIPEDYVASDLVAGELVEVLAAWSPPFPGYHLYYPSRRQQSPAFALLVDALRHRSS